jgi:hypothetical protein
MAISTRCSTGPVTGPSLGDPDPFRQRHRQALRQLVGDLVRRQMDRKEAIAFIGEWVNNDVAPDERARFREMAESDLLGLHEGNFARFQVRPSEFAAWQIEWENKELLFPAREERYDNSRDVVAFGARDRAQRVPCVISQEALDDHSNGDRQNKLDVFRQNHPAIEDIARSKYLSGHVEPDGSVLIRTKDTLH